MVPVQDTAMPLERASIHPSIHARSKLFPPIPSWLALTARGGEKNTMSDYYYLFFFGSIAPLLFALRLKMKWPNFFSCCHNNLFAWDACFVLFAFTKKKNEWLCGCMGNKKITVQKEEKSLGNVLGDICKARRKSRDWECGEKKKMLGRDESTQNKGNTHDQSNKRRIERLCSLFGWSWR